MICALCGKKIRWWQKSVLSHWRKIKRVELDGTFAVIPDNESRRVMHRKCYKPTTEAAMAAYYEWYNDVLNRMCDGIKKGVRKT